MTEEQEKPLTQEEIEKMRSVVQQHDRQAGVTEFDLNKPTSGVIDEFGKLQPYSYKEFPKVLYDHKNRKSIVVASKEEMEKKAKEGFQKEPFPAEPPKHEYDMVLGADNLKQESVLDRDKGSVLDRDRHAPPQGPNDKSKGK